MHTINSVSVFECAWWRGVGCVGFGGFYIEGVGCSSAEVALACV